MSRAVELLFAGIALAGFFGGLGLLKSALSRLEPVAGPLLRQATKSPLRAFLSGLAVTALIQSSSATGVMTVALAAAGALGLRQAFGLVLGANVGTTVTGQIVAFGTLDLGLAMLGTAAALRLPLERIPHAIVRKRPSKFRRGLPSRPRTMPAAAWCDAAGGLGAVFASLWCIGRLLHPAVSEGLLAPYGGAIATDRLSALLFGALATAVVQSSSAVTGLLIGWADAGGLPLETGIAAALGANVGTVATILLASIGGGTAARRTAVADLAFNLLGVLLVWPVLDPFETLVGLLSQDPGRQVAHAHTLFNLATAALLLPFLSPFCAAIERIVPERRKA